MRILNSVLLVLALMSIAGIAMAHGIDPKADQLLHRMSDLLASSKTVSFTTVEVHDRHQRSGKTGQLRFSRQVVLQRPDGLWMHGIGKQGGQASVWYNGKSLVLQSDKEKVYGKVHMPPTLDEALDFAATNLDMPMPMADIFYSSPYDALVSTDTKGGFVKVEKVGSNDCSQLAFQSDVVDWRIWIADVQKPLLCQLEITYKQDQDQPKSLMTFADWNFDPKIEASTFQHTPPEGYRRIPILGYAIASNNTSQENQQTQERKQ